MSVCSITGSVLQSIVLFLHCVSSEKKIDSLLADSEAFQAEGFSQTAFTSMFLALPKDCRESVGARWSGVGLT